jgi:hypothetical protein
MDPDPPGWCARGRDGSAEPNDAMLVPPCSCGNAPPAAHRTWLLALLNSIVPDETAAAASTSF